MTYDEVLLALTDEEAEWAFLLGPEEFWMWWDRHPQAATSRPGGTTGPRRSA